jgi:hypothetical protein
MIVTDVQALCIDLCGQLAIAKLPDDTDKRGEIGRCDFDKPLACCLHAHDPSVVLSHEYAD